MPKKPKQSKCQIICGVKDIVNDKSVDQIVTELMVQMTPNHKELETLKYKSDLNTTSSPTDPVMQNDTSQASNSNNNVPASTTMSSENLRVLKSIILKFPHSPQ